MEAGGYDLKATGRAFLTAFGEDELTVRAGDLAFRFFLALFPLLLFITAAGALIADIAGVDDPSGEVVDAIGDALPEDATSVIRGQIDGVVDSRAGPLLLIVGMLGSLWAASSGVGAAVKAINAMDEDAPGRPFIKGTALALGVTTIGGLAVIGLFAGAIVAQVYAEDIARALGVGGQYNLVVGLVQVPLMLVVLMAVVAVLYRIAPVTSHPFRDRLPGAVAFVILWAPFTIAFAFYVANFGSYNATYGAIGGAVILMFWIYYSSLLLLAGRCSSASDRHMRPWSPPD